MHPKERVRGIIDKGRGVTRLAGKVVGELRDPKQFLDPERRRTLLLHGKHLTSAVMTTPDRDTSNIEEEIAQTLQTFPIRGAKMYVNERYYLPAVVFPDGSEIDFVSLLDTDDRREPEPKFFVTETTVGRTDERFPGYPTEGYTRGERNFSRFQPRDAASQIQHGGFYIDAQNHSIAILNYDDLQPQLTRPLGGTEAVVEANWYMDSETANEVSARPNMQELNDHNILGELFRPDGSVAFFSISSYTFSVVALYQRASLRPPDIALQTKTTPRHIAALSNLVAKSEGAQSWAVCGLEYANGGTYPYRRSGSGSFQIRY
ncbi:MAG: hypothetical protein Q8Q49_05305 [bacterium]|nr:hypothetical protein [bacterium]